MQISELQAVLQRWEEEHQVFGNKSTLTEQNIRGLRCRIRNAQSAERLLRISIETAQRFIGEV